ncbi:MAG: DNA primase [Acidimicrobiales bacterium]|nr:DNA primase [Acidimicrobiales bacterium]
MGIVDEDIQRVRESSDIVAVVSAHTQLKKTGGNWSGLCPFHGEKSPSFSVNQDKGVYYCFGCQARGDVITFVREIDHLDFQAAVEFLASKAGIALRYTDRNEGDRREARGKLREAMAAAVDWYHERLLSGGDSGAARHYLRERGFDGDMVRHYKIGWAPDDWDQLVKALPFNAKVLKDAGLGRENKHGGTNDFFRARVLFPIFDSQGDPIGFGGRQLPGGRPPKYQNSPETALYSKSKVLYGLNWAKDEAVRSNEIIICEGYTDVIGFASVGLARAVATCGTALTDEHVRILQRFAPKLVLAFDPDAAGQAAAERVYEWEQKHEVEVAVAVLPSGADPADLARSQPDALRASIANAQPFLGFRVDRILNAADLFTPEGRGRGAEAALVAVAEHPNEFVRDQYVMTIAGRCRLEPDHLRTALRSGRSRPRVRVQSQRTRPQRVETPETNALRLAIADPQEVLPLLEPVLFDDPRNRSAFVTLREFNGDLIGATQAADPLVAELLSRLAVESTDATPADIRRLLLRDLALRTLDEIKGDHSLAADVAAWSEAVSRLRLAIEALETARPEDPADVATEGELLAWLAQWREVTHE